MSTHEPFRRIDPEDPGASDQGGLEFRGTGSPPPSERRGTPPGGTRPVRGPVPPYGSGTGHRSGPGSGSVLGPGPDSGSVLGPGPGSVLGSGHYSALPAHGPDPAYGAGADSGSTYGSGPGQGSGPVYGAGPTQDSGQAYGSMVPVPSRPGLPDNLPAAPFARYAALLRHLDEVRAGDEARTESWRRCAASMTAVAEEIGPMIIEHSRQLEMLGHAMRLKVVRTGAQKITEEVDPVEALNTARDLTNETATLANEAKRLGEHAAFLPTWRPGYRNFVVYLACAVVTALLQCLLFMANNNNPPTLLVLFVLPLLSWITGLTVIRYYGQPAIPPPPGSRKFRVGMPPPPDPMTRSPRMGVLLCFGAFPLWYLGIVIAARDWFG